MAEQKPVMLVVDDDPTVLEMIYEGLSDHNFNVIAAGDPNEGLKKTEGLDLDFALLDLDLGWQFMTGIELGISLRRTFPDLVVIIMTGYHNIKFAVDAMRKHSFHYMIKPFRSDQIVSLTERAQRELGLKRENESLRQELEILKDENIRLKKVVDEIRPEEKGLALGSREKGYKRRIQSADALNSYERQKKPNFLKPQNIANSADNPSEDPLNDQ